jgi:hypothetical protein
MKKIALIFMFLFTGFMNAQDAYITTTSGEKIVIQNSEYYYATFKKVRYFNPKGGIQKGIKVDEVKELIDGNIIYKPYSVNGKKPDFFKIIAKAPNKTLLVHFIVPDMNSHHSNVAAEYKIIDDAGKELVSGYVNSEYSKKKKQEEQDNARKILTAQFKDCTEMLQNLGNGTMKTHDGTIIQEFTNSIDQWFMVQDKIYECK